MKVEIEPDELIERTTDDRGRITIGSEHANEDVKLILLKDD